MARAHTYKKLLGALIVTLLAWPTVLAQTFVGVSVPTTLCDGAADTLTFGFAPTSDVTIEAEVARLSHPDTVFLPDGVPCGEYGCSYRSPVTFTDFAAGATISGVNDIRYVRLNMEHSYVKDLYINITCPNGQKAVLMKFGGENNSQCKGAIPASAEGWSNGWNIDGRAAFGIPNGGSNKNSPCDPTADNNGPGTGWNYCWSNNTSEGYTYASGDGIIYRNGHVHDGRVDSSKVAQGQRFYHPDQSLQALVGCPLNGDWYIEVVDGYKQDNGYIFDWELALNPALLPSACELTGRGVESIKWRAESGEWRVGNGPLTVVKLNDSTYTIEATGEVENDTEVGLRFWMSNSCGDTVDTVVYTTIVATRYGNDSVEAIGAYYLDGHAYTTDTVLTMPLTASTGCDSVHTRYVTVYHDIYVEYDTLICDPEYPIDWRGYHFLGGGVAHMTLTASSGVDSNVTLTLVEAWSVDTSVSADICMGESYLLGDTLLGTDGHHERLLATEAGCDSMVRVELAVHPTYDSLTIDTACATEGYWFESERIYAAGEYHRTYPTLYGCDSTVRLKLDIIGEGLKAVALAAPAVVTAEKPDLRLTDASRGAVARLWTIDGKEHSDKTLYITYPIEEDSLPVTLVAYGSEQCTDTHAIVVRIDRSALAVPNVFTPDAAENNRWRIAQRDVVELAVWIYNRQGMLMTTLEGTDAEWDGTSGGTPCPQGAYAFKAQYTTRAYPERIQTTEGTILLLR